MSDYRPVVSIAMVTYNSEQYVSQAVRSVLSSSYKNFEFVICDDNSTDNTWQIINSFEDARICAYRNEQNLGEYENRNQCLSKANGEYLLFIDGDDMIYPHGLEFMIKMIQAFPGCGMALMRWYKRNIFYPVVITPYQFYQGVYFNYGFNDIAFANTLFNTEILKTVGGLSVNHKAGDNYIRLVIGKRFNTLLINDGLTWWRETPNQASVRINSGPEGFIESVELEMEMLAKDCPLSLDEVKQAKYNIETKILRQLVHSLKSRQFSVFNIIRRRFNIPFWKLAQYGRKPIVVDPFAAYSPSDPFMIPFNENPLSADAKNI